NTRLIKLKKQSKECDLPLNCLRCLGQYPGGKSNNTKNDTNGSTALMNDRNAGFHCAFSRINDVGAHDSGSCTAPVMVCAR
ncbi:MAG: hypothetical protein ACREX0_14990, partial [Noviherbaspirillum sp.]